MPKPEPMITKDPGITWQDHYERLAADMRAKLTPEQVAAQDRHRAECELKRAARKASFVAPSAPDDWNADPLLTTEQTADYLGVPRQTLAVWRCRKPPFGPAHMRVGRYIRYRASDINAWLDNQRIDPAKAA